MVLNAMHFIPGMVANLKKLEKGVIMFSGEHNESVLVRAPVMFISANNPAAYSDICGLLQQTTPVLLSQVLHVEKEQEEKQDFG